MNSALEHLLPELSKSIKHSQFTKLQPEQILQDYVSEFQKYLDYHLQRKRLEEQSNKKLFINPQIIGIISIDLAQQKDTLIQYTNQFDLFKAPEKQMIIKTFHSLSNVLKIISEKFMASILINQTIINVERDTIRQLFEMQDLFQILFASKSCGRDTVIKQFDLQFRRIQQYTFFWEIFISLESVQEPIIIENEQFVKSTNLVEKIQTWINHFNLESKQLRSSRKILSSIFQDEKYPPNKEMNETQLLNALQFHSGLGRSKNQLEAFHLFKQLAQKGNSVAQSIIGQLILDGQICELNYDHAFDYFKMSADQKDSFGLYHAAKLLLEGRVVNKIFDENGTPSSKYANQIYSQGDECQFAITMLKLSSEMGLVEPILYLGDLYCYGHQLFDFILEPDFAISELYYKEAKKKGSIEANYKLAKLYVRMSKISIYKNRVTLIVPLLQEAKNNDYIPAYFELAETLFEGIKDELPQNVLMAELIFEQGAIKGNEKCAEKILILKFSAFQNNQINIEEFGNLMDSIDDVFKNQQFTIYYRAKIFHEGIKTNSNLQLANELLISGAYNGCQKCKLELASQSKLELSKKPETSEQQAKFKPNLGFIQQIKQTDWRLRFKKPSIVSNQQNKSRFDNDISTIPDRFARMTCSMIKTPETMDIEKKRNRVISDYTGFSKQGFDQSILLSNVILNPTEQQNQSKTLIQEEKYIHQGQISRKERINLYRQLSQKSLHSNCQQVSNQ